MDDQARELLDYQNRERVEHLSQKVSLLKNYAIDIEHETKLHNRLLDEVTEECYLTYNNTNIREIVSTIMSKSS